MSLDQMAQAWLDSVERKDAVIMQLSGEKSGLEGHPMSLECGICERDLRGEHDPDCKFFRGEIVSNGAQDRTKMTWRCDKCGAEWDHLTYGGPCPGRDLEGCHGELQRRKVMTGALQ